MVTDMTKVAKLVIKNRDDISFGQAIDIIHMTMPGCTIIRAEQLAYIIHFKGKCTALTVPKSKRGSLENIAETMMSHGLDIEII